MRQAKTVAMFNGGGFSHIGGGVGVVTRNLLDEWEGRPEVFPVDVIDTRGQGGAVGGMVAFLRAISRLVGLRARGRLGLVHVHMAERGSVVRKCSLALLGRLLGVPTVFHLHGAQFQEFVEGLPNIGKRAIRFSLNSAPYVIVLGETWRRYLVADLGVAPEKIRVIYNGVPSPNCPAKLPSASEVARILFLGRLGDRKG
ncbi:MAG: glycosyltransferase family 4 protein, partial [Pseudomonadota bacterium]|nr:glycosyltransferase family 4 protein [Pseudomonadota bacterium]